MDASLQPQRSSMISPLPLIRSNVVLLFYRLGRFFWYSRPFVDRLRSCLRGLWPGWLTTPQREQCIKSENLLSQPLPVTKGVAQGSILGPTLLNIHQHSFVLSKLSSMYMSVSLQSSTYSLDFVLNTLQSFLSVQQAFSVLNLVQNISKTKVMWFVKKNVPLSTGVITIWGFRASGSHLIQVLGSMARWYTVLLSKYQSWRLKWSLDLVSFIVITPFTQLPI
jgi:hypothetical protein